MPDQSEDFVALNELNNSAIEIFNSKKIAMIDKDREQGGDGHAVWDALDTLRRARSKLTQRALDANQPGFDQLAKSAKAATEDLNGSIDELETVSDVLNKVSRVVSLVGKILIMFGG